MAFTIRGSANALNKASKVENKNGFQEVSAPGPRQGVGGSTKCTPITQKASPLKINNTLVKGAADAAPRFVNVRAAMGRGISETYN